jgi:hypothetical protein
MFPLLLFSHKDHLLFYNFIVKQKYCKSVVSHIKHDCFVYCIFTCLLLMIFFSLMVVVLD